MVLWYAVCNAGEIVNIVCCLKALVPNQLSGLRIQYISLYIYILNSSNNKYNMIKYNLSYPTPNVHYG